MTSKNISATAAPRTTAKVGITKTTKKTVTPQTPKTLGNNLSAKARKIVGKLVEGMAEFPDTYLAVIIYLYSQMSDANSNVLEIFRHYDFDNKTWINRISEEELHVLQGELKEVVLYCFHKINQRDHNSYENSWWCDYGRRYGSQEVNICVEEEGEDYIDYTIDNGVFCPLPNEVVELCYRLTNPTQGSTIFLPFAADSQFATYLDGYRYEGFESNVIRCILGGILKEMCGMDAEISYYESPLEAINRVRGKRYEYIFTYLPFYDNIYDGVRDNLRTQFFDLMEQLEDGGEMCCILPYTACFSYEWKDFRKRFIKNEGGYSANVILLPHRNYNTGSECLFFIKKDGLGAISFVNARGNDFIQNSVETDHSVLNVQSVVEAVFGRVKSGKFSDLDEKLGLSLEYYSFSSEWRESNHKEILGNFVDIIPASYNEEMSSKECECYVYSRFDMMPDWFNCELPKKVLDHSEGCKYILDKKSLLCAWDGVQFRVGKISDSLVGQAVYLKDGIIPIRIKSDAISEDFLLMTLSSKWKSDFLFSLYLFDGGKVDEEHFLSLLIDVPSKEIQKQMCESDNKKGMQKSDAEFRKDVRMKKHAIGQTIATLDSWWSNLEWARKEGNGVLVDTNTIGRREMPIADIYKNIQDSIIQLQRQISRFDSGQIMSSTEMDLNEFIEDYIRNHQSPHFRFEYISDKRYDKKEGAVEYVDFSPEALERVFENIISNAESHGFKNREEGDNVVRIELASEGFDRTITISNNGHPIPADFPVEDIFVYARSTCRGKDHGGLGGYDIRRLMQDFNGEVQIISLPEAEFPVSYRLTFHNAQPDDKFDMKEMKDMKDFVEKNFRKFDPKTDGKDRLPDVPGNYILALRKGSHLPEIGVTPVMKTLTFDNVEYEVIYTGISKDSLRSRDYDKHFTGNNAGRSTLRKSLGSLMGFKKIPRDKNNPDNGKVKFGEADEVRLSEWMANNLLLFYRGTSVGEVDGLELKLIDFLNPPLNLKDNHNPVNSDFRNKLSDLRK